MLSNAEIVALVDDYGLFDAVMDGHLIETDVASVDADLIGDARDTLNALYGWYADVAASLLDDDE